MLEMNPGKELSKYLYSCQNSQAEVLFCSSEFTYHQHFMFLCSMGMS